MEVTLQLADPDSLALLKRALENYQAMSTAMATRETHLAGNAEDRTTSATTAQLTRRAGIYSDRAAIVGRLVAQLPPDTAAPLPPQD